MSWDWADNIARQLSSRGLMQKGICLVLGASDTGKTTLTMSLAEQLACRQPIGIVDADIGQSHIGPPTTVGWAIVDKSAVCLADKPPLDFSRLAVSGISFVGHVTPVGHLLQLTAAIVQGVQQVSKLTELIIIDTPGLVIGPAAAALWWTVQQILKPRLILAVQRQDELSGILSGLKSFDLQLERIESPPQIAIKSPQERQSYRKSQFIRYFRDAGLYNINLTDMAVQPGRSLSSESFINRLVALRNQKGIDVALGLITGWQRDGIMVVKAPPLDIRQIRCLVIGDITIDISGQ